MDYKYGPQRNIKETVMSKKYVNSCIDRVIVTGTVSSIREDLPFVSSKNMNLVISTARKAPSAAKDIINVVVNKNFMKNIKVGSYIKVLGSIQTKMIDGHLYIYVYTYDITLIDNHDVADIDQANFEGYICKKPVLRSTPLTNRKICDFVLAVNDRGYSYYIPCICWGNNAKKMARNVVGDKVFVTGRIPSREYNKKEEINIAHEVSVFYIQSASYDSKN